MTMLGIILTSYLPNVLLTALLGVILWKAGLRGIWLITSVGPMVAAPLGLWLMQVSVPGIWGSMAVKIGVPFVIKWLALFILAFKKWPQPTANLQPLET
jgi:hypothetical protein